MRLPSIPAHDNMFAPSVVSFLQIASATDRTGNYSSGLKESSPLCCPSGTCPGFTTSLREPCCAVHDSPYWPLCQKSSASPGAVMNIGQIAAVPQAGLRWDWYGFLFGGQLQSFSEAVWSKALTGPRCSCGLSGPELPSLPLGAPPGLPPCTLACLPSPVICSPPRPLATRSC